jgi:hypothetical protein
LSKKIDDNQDTDDHRIDSVDDYRFLQKKMVELASENQQLNDEVDRLSFLLSQKGNKEKFGKIWIDVNYLVEILNFEKYIANQTHVYLIHYDNKFIRIVPSYELSNTNFEIKEARPQQKKETPPEYDSIV